MPAHLLCLCVLAPRSYSAVLLHGCIGGQRRTFSEIPASALGKEIPCPHCGKPIRLNPFTINADWRQVGRAWGTAPEGTETNAGSGRSDPVRKAEGSAADRSGKSNVVKKPWWKFWK